MILLIAFKNFITFIFYFIKKNCNLKMKNEIKEYLENNKDNLHKLTEEVRNIITDINTSPNAEAFVFMNLLEYLNKESLIDDFLSYISENFDNELANSVKKLLVEEKNSFLETLLRIRNGIENSQIFLVDIEWKFVGLLDINANDLRDMEPKILLKLVFSNDTFKIIETNYSNFKKIQEEIEENVQSFNSIYTKRIINFSK